MSKLLSSLKSVATFVNGWQVWIVAAVLIWKELCHNCASSGFVVSVLNAVGWDTSVSVLPVDPKATALGLVAVFVMGQHLYQAYKQWKAGVPIKYVQTDKGAVLATVNTGSVKAIVAELNKETPAETAAVK